MGLTLVEKIAARHTDGLAPGAVHDYEAEYRGIQALRAQGLADVELHGYTHMYANPEVWAVQLYR